jgi:anti-sigma B factor antagonist
VFNLSKIGFFSSPVISMILSFAREARTKGGDVRLCALSHDARTMVQITNLDHVFEIFADEQKAVDSYKA